MSQPTDAFDEELKVVNDGTKNRGNVKRLEVPAVENFCLVFGCEPSFGVSVKTAMVKDFIEHMHRSSDPISGVVQLPKCLQTMEGKDAKFETVSSSKIQPAIMVRKDRLTLTKVALFFMKDSYTYDGQLCELDLNRKIDEQLQK